MKLTKLIGLSIGSLLFATSAIAVPVAVTHGTDAGDSFNTTEISGFTTGGDDMDGIEVTVYFADGTSETAVYDIGTLGDNYGAASGTDWTLSFNGSTSFVDSWNFDFTGDNAITSLVIDGTAGDTLFDYWYDDTTTPGSARGGPGDPAGPVGVDSTIDGLGADFTYRNQVALDGTFYGDLFTQLVISFDSPFYSGQSFSFVTDTDNVTVQGDITPIPEPAILALFSLGLLGMALRRS